MDDLNMKKIVNILALLIVGCVGIPDGVKPVDHFQVERHLGNGNAGVGIR